MAKAYRELYEKGEFKDLLYYASLDESDRGNFWQLMAFVNLRLFEHAWAVIYQYEDNFSDVEDSDLRQNFQNIADSILAYRKERPSMDMSEELWKMFSPSFPDMSKELIITSYLTDKGIQFGDYMCKYAVSEEKISELKRQFDLLNAINGNLRLHTPKPLEFKRHKTKDIAMFYYRIIQGSVFAGGELPIAQLLDLLIELRKLSDIKPVKELLLYYTPEIDLVARKLTQENMEENFEIMDEEKIAGILSFIDLCKNHLTINYEDRSFVHGDLYFGNLIQDLRTKNLVGIIDFERGWYSDPVIDFSKLNYNDEFLQKLLKTYNATFEEIDVDYTLARALLYRGWFILRKLKEEWVPNVEYKLTKWVVEPIDNIQGLL